MGRCFAQAAGWVASLAFVMTALGSGAEECYGGAPQPPLLQAAPWIHKGGERRDHDPHVAASFALMQLRSDLDKRGETASDRSAADSGTVTIRDAVAGVAQAVADAASNLSMRWQPPSFFSGFSDGESTFDDDAAVERARAERFRGLQPTGAIVDSEVPHDGPIRTEDGTIASKWFDESASGGAKAAWQTHYPALEDSHPRGAPNEQWLSTQGGRWHQDFEPPYGAVSSRASKVAAWFDNSVTQYDAYGRPREPSEYSGRRYPNWKEISRNVSLVCKESGCIANSTLLAYNPSTERSRRCLLTIAIHATDFDDEYSRENVEWISVNGRTVNSVCDPMAKGCNPNKSAVLYNCVRDLNLPENVLLEGNGTLNISAKLSKMVDECPHEGNLLSGVASVTCLISPKPPKRNRSAASPWPQLQAPTANTSNNTGLWKLRCSEPGCVANVTLKLPGTNGTNCKLTIRLNQTDFDAANELVEWIKIDGKVVSTDLKLGENPCKARAEGKKVTDKAFTAVDAQDVVSAAADGTVVVSVKISEMVDECGRSGYLVDGDVSVDCTPTATLVAITTTVSPPATPQTQTNNSQTTAAATGPKNSSSSTVAAATAAATTTATAAAR